MRQTGLRLPILSLTLVLLAGCESGSSGIDPEPPTSCESGGAIRLAVGQTTQLSGPAAGEVCVEATSLGEEFVLVLTSLREAGSALIRAQTENAMPVLGPPSPTPPRAGALASSPLDLDLRLPSAGLHSTLRDRERSELAIVGGGPPGGRALSAPPALSVPFPGQLLELNAQSESACEDPIMVTARVEAVSEKAIVAADVDNPTEGFQQADYEHFADTFDTLVYPTLEEHFGAPSDLDSNGRIIILFTKEVNALEGNEDEESFTSGFFFSRDLFPVQTEPPLAGCATSNQAELLYLIVPDPAGEAGDPIDREFVERFTVTSIAHEGQHLINASERLFGLGGPFPFEMTWLNEALSHTAEELLFYEASGFAPRMDIGLDDLDLESLEAINAYQLFNYLRLRRFFLDPASSSPFSDDDLLTTRGGAWSFLRYVADRLPGTDATLFRDLVASPLRGLENLALSVGDVSTVFDFLGDWSVGLYGDNRIQGLPQQFHDRSWDNPSLFDGAEFEPPYIQTSSLGAIPDLTETLVGGGSLYLRFAAPQGNRTRIVLTSDGAPPPSTLRVSLLRTR